MPEQIAVLRVWSALRFENRVFWPEIPSAYAMACPLAEKLLEQIQL